MVAGNLEAIVIDDSRIETALHRYSDNDPYRFRDVLAKAMALKGLNEEDVAVLTAVTNPALLDELFHTARWAKEEIYGRRLVFFAPLYVSNLCSNECLYCAFSKSNAGLTRRALTQEEVEEETRLLIDQGHKRVLLVSGESYPIEGFAYILSCIDTIYATKHINGEIRRINVNVAPLSVDQFRELKAAHIGTYQCFQETYHRETYANVHPSGKKADYDWRITAIDRAMRAGIDDVGVGVLFGLYDWRYEIMALMQHIAHLETTFGFGCHTISVPRIEPASGCTFSEKPPYAVSDDDFKKVVAILRLAVPYTGMIMSTRESPEMRRATFELGVSQISAGSRTNPGGYADEEYDASQFSLGDHRSLDEVVRDVVQLGFIPSFCTACYRLGRTGADFMDLAKPGLIKDHCDVNAMSTLQEYMEDYATPETRAMCEQQIGPILSRFSEHRRRVAQTLMDQVKEGKRDVFV
ncbi:MAG: [FeFe] hydrogenase H-cluster radical SAM maturase HydG [Candidatus Hydrogenedentota bacterium]